MSEAARIAGVFFSPGKAFADIARRPRWWIPVILIALIGTVYLNIFTQRVGWESVIRPAIERSAQTQNMTAQQREQVIATASRLYKYLGYGGSAVGTLFYVFIVAVLLMFGPVISSAIANHAGGAGSAIKIAWWAAQWPILFFGLLAAFATLLYLGPDVDLPKWEFLTPGSVVAVLLWLAASAGFAVYTATFASYNKTWGSLAAVIVMLTWLWITGMALLLGAEINAEAERSRRLRAKTV